LMVMCFAKYSSVPRRPDLTSNHPHMVRVENGLRRIFDCKHRSSCDNPTGICIDFLPRGQHFPLTSLDIIDCAKNHIQNDRTLLASIINLVMKKVDEKEDRRPGSFEKNSVSLALLDANELLPDFISRLARE